jgi:hypothetical protein
MADVRSNCPASCGSCDGPTWLFSSVPMVDGGDHCDQHEPEVLRPGYHVDELFFAGCPLKQDMSITRTCLGFSDCPVLTRCVVTEQRFDAEVHALPFGDLVGYEGGTSGYFALANCGDHAASKELLSAKQLASPTRAEYVIAPTLYGEHFIEHRVYRDEPEAPQVTFTAASGADKFVITARPVPATTALPMGYSHFESDVIDIEALDVLRLGSRVECAAAHSNLHIVMGVVDPSAGYHIFPVHRDAAGALHFGAAPAVEGERAIHVSQNGNASVVALADHDECLDGSHECSSTSECVNTVGSYFCACLAGHSRHDGTTDSTDRWGKSCRKDAFECPEVSVRVSAAEAFEVGWRIREVTLFSDDKCVTPAVSPKVDESSRRRNGVGANNGGHPEAVQPLTMEAYTTVSYHQCVGPEIPAWNHPREIVRASQCFAKCRGDERGARKLSPKRRMQLDPTDWNNCQGAARAGSDKNDNALCASVETCQSICSQLHDCAGFSYVDYACVLHSACDVQQYTGNGYYARAVKKEPVVKVSSSHGEHIDRMRLHEGWAEHPVSLITDGFGQPSHEGVDFTNTEWWSQCWSCQAEEAWVELTVRPDGDCHVHSVQVLQDAQEEHSARRLNFAVGAGPFTRGPRPDASRELAQIGQYFSSWQYQKREDDCYALTCGEPGMYSGETIRSIENVASPCLCKQLCLETAGCEVYNLYKEADNHWDDYEYADDHEHWFCYLIGADWQAADVATEHWTRGTVDTTLQGFVRTGGLSNFDLEVHGYHLSDSNARLKIVKWRDAADNCADPLADTVGGIGCSDSFICAPKPAKFDRDHADWVGLSIAQGAENQDYRVCYCKGPCYAGWQYSPVGTEPLEVDGVGYGWRLADPAKCSVDRDANGIVLEVSRPIFHSLSDSADWAVKFVAATGSCADAAPQSNGVSRLATSDVGQELDNRTYELDIVNERATAGRYIVCLAEDGVNFVEIDGLDCGRYLDVQFIAEDLEAPEGYFTGQRFSAMAGEEEASITVKGNFPNWDQKTRVAISAGDMGDLGYMVLGDFGSFHDFVLPAAEVWSDGDVVMSYNLSALEAGTHSVLVQYTCRQGDAGCIADFPQYGKCKQSDPGDNHAGGPGDLILHQCEIGKLTASARVDQGWTYVLDPTTEGSIEVTGEGLDWKKDRIMLVDCEATCGVSSPAGVHLEGSAQTLLGANTFVAQNDHFDRPSDDVEPTVDLPSELRTYTTAVGAYCVGHNMAAGTQVEAGAFRQDQCYNKCAACTQAGTPCPASCNGYLELQDGPMSGALCMTEVECRTLCTATEGCVGIDMYRTSDRCYLNAATPQPGDQTEAQSCADQFESGHMGVHPDYKYLHLHRGHARARALSSGLSHSRLLRFAPVSFSGGGSYKVCFCDHELLPDGQEHCLAEADYSIEIGKVYASGVSCLLAEDKFRRGTCHEQHHGGLACSESLTRHGADAAGASAGLPSAYDLY